jgi:hypothetical protein
MSWRSFIKNTALFLKKSQFYVGFGFLILSVLRVDLSLRLVLSEKLFILYILAVSMFQARNTLFVHIGNFSTPQTCFFPRIKVWQF